MARYVKDFPMVDDFQNTYPQISRLLHDEKYLPRTRDGEQVFQKGDGVWLAASFVKVTRLGNTVRLEAWVDVWGADQGLEGFAGSAVKKPLKKIVARIEQILTKPNENYVPAPETAENSAEVKFCNICGTPLTEEDKFCTACGAVVVSKLYNGAPMDKNISKKAFLKQYAGESFYKNLKVVAIIGYVLAGISAIAIFANPAAIIDVVVMLGLTLGMHLGRSKACAIGLTAYGAFWMVYNLVMYGMFSSWGILLVGVYGLIIFAGADKRYKEMTKQ